MIIKTMAAGLAAITLCHTAQLFRKIARNGESL
ncbi:hypothetical protein DR64_227 [Paraburkholderia xenovorans LB400]|nr:hypothetical protein DR64_227 [Paraburkholderia xenovorans LB400]